MELVFWNPADSCLYQLGKSAAGIIQIAKKKYLRYELHIFPHAQSTALSKSEFFFLFPITDLVIAAFSPSQVWRYRLKVPRHTSVHLRINVNQAMRDKRTLTQLIMESISPTRTRLNPFAVPGA